LAVRPAAPCPPAVAYGAAPDRAALAAVLLHGRDRTSGEMVALAERMDLPGVAWRALEAPGGSWYPGSFMDPIVANQPQLDQSLAQIEREVGALQARGLPRSRIALVGFSQGACVACDYVRRHPGRWGALIAFTGGLPGPDGAAWSADRGLEGTPILLSNSEADPFVPWTRVEQTARAFEGMGGAVTLELHPGRDHSVSEQEIATARAILSSAAQAHRS
jgi:phospholipase/carboxylesterase